MSEITNQDIKETKGDSTLGPSYYASRRIVEGILKDMPGDWANKVLEKAADDLYAKIQESVEEYLWADTVSNLQTKMWRQVDDIVKYLLNGEEWAVKKYVLGDRYDCGKVRKAIAEHIPEELQNTLVADLRKENETLKRDLSFYRDRS